jgi:hypothetical protein
MGTTTSSEANLTPEQLDLRLLGDRLPFADSEIRVLYAAFQLFQHIENKQTFLCDWSHSIGAGGLFDTLQDKVLPKNFGNALYEAAFCAKGDTTRYRLNNAASIQLGDAANAAGQQRPQVLDEFTRKTRLETFFDGLARCSRRGPTSALTVLFHTLRVLERQQPENEDANNDAATVSSNDNQNDSVSALTFVTTGYLLARATRHLQRPETPILDEAMPGQHADVQALAHSIVAKARGRRKRYGLPDDCPHLLQARVELQDILDWAEAAAPMFGTSD